MKSKIIAGILAVSLVVGLVAYLKPNEVVAEQVNSSSVIEVYGTGTVKVKPDIAVLSIGVMSSGKDTLIQKENSEIMMKVIASVKELGVSEKDIQTTNYYMNPEYNYINGSTGELLGYKIYNNIEVKVRNIEKAGDILNKAVENGANINNGIQFKISNPEEVYNQALVKAIENGNTKAKSISGSLGVTIGKPSKVTEESGVGFMTSNYYMNSKSVGESSSSVPVESGEIQITANVLMNYNY